VLGSGFPRSSAILIDAFKEGLRESGLIEGRNYLLDVRWAEGDYRRFATLASELAQRRPNVIIVMTTMAAGQAARQAAPTTAIVMTGFIDPVGAGLINQPFATRRKHHRNRKLWAGNDRKSTTRGQSDPSE
jgi:putative ABC transport system substrate-binding protein